jgi:hypothetical protein
MIRPTRIIHRLTWTILLVVIPILLFLALTNREPIPTMERIPLEVSE